MGIADRTRDNLAKILETVAHDGLPEPRDLDVALDAIECTIFDVQGLPHEGEFSYLIAHRDSKNEDYLACYMYGSKEVFFGDRKDAASMLSYVRKQAPGKHWQIIPCGVG